MVSTTKYAKKVNNKDKNSENVCSICTWLRSGIQLILKKFKIIKFINNKRGQIGKPIENEELMAYLVDISIILNNNGFPFKNNIKYI